MRSEAGTSEELARRDPLGQHTLYYARSGTGWAHRVGHLFEETSLLRTLSPAGVAGYLNQAPLEGATCFEAVAEVPAGHALLSDGSGYRTHAVPGPTMSAGGLEDILLRSVEAVLRAHRTVALALSGGFDSAFVLGLVDRLGGENVVVYTLAADLPGYEEREATLATARHFRRDVELVGAGEEEFVAALPEAIAAMETPLYNLHPLSKFLLARRLRDDGIHAVLTGDGADQVFSGVDASNYIPIIGSLFASHGVALHSPFMAEETVAYCRRHLTPDPKKGVLRDLGRGLLPDGLIRQKKRRTLTPPMDLSRYWDATLVEGLSDAVAYPLPESFDRDTDRVKWVTLSLLYQIVVEGRSPT